MDQVASLDYRSFIQIGLIPYHLRINLDSSENVKLIFHTLYAASLNLATSAVAPQLHPCITQALDSSQYRSLASCHSSPLPLVASC